MSEKILLFIPMYNCEKQITRVLGQVDENILKYISEIIVVNNRSTDAGENAAVEYCKKHRELPVKILRNDENYGLGGSHKVAFQYAVRNNYDYMITLHGDDQGRIQDFLPVLESKEYQDYDCFLGTRFMKGSRLIGYSKIRIWGNYGFNLLFTIAAGKTVKDLGSGLNIYKVSVLKNEFFLKYPDNLYFNAVMVLASCFYKHKMLFYPISWREDDQISNNKLWTCSCFLLKMLWGYIRNKKGYLEKDLRAKAIEEYTAQVVWDNK